MNLQRKKVLVTGAGGFIGSHLAERLVSDGARVRAFLHYNSRGDMGMLEFLPREVLRKIEIVWGDLKDGQSVKRAVKGTAIVFHLGALTGIPYSYLNPQEVFDTNLGGTLNILNASLEHNVARVVATSTSEVYGTARYVPIDEEHPLQAQSPYAASKIAADKACESFFRAFDLPVVVVRPFNTYGPRQSARAVIPTIIAQALTSNTIKLGALTPRRDMTYVSDMVDGFVAAAICPKCIGEVINLGTGACVSVRELVRIILKLLGKKAKVVQEKRRIRPRRSEVMRLVADCGKAQRLLRWSPRVTLTEGLSRTIGWMKQNIGIYKPEFYSV